MNGERVKTVNWNYFLGKTDGKRKMWSAVVMRSLYKFEKDSRMNTNYFVARKRLESCSVILDYDLG